VSSTQSSVHLVDLASGERQVLAGGEGRQVRNYAVAIDRTAEGFYYLTDAGREFTALVYRRFEADAVPEVITEDIAWDVSAVVFSDDGGRAAFTANEGGLTAIYLMDPITRTYARIEGIPAGVAGNLAFSPAGDRLAMTLNTPKTPSDTFTLALGPGPLDHGELVRWTFSEVGGLDTERFVEPELVRYPTFDEVDGETRTIPAFVYTPEGPGPHPVVVSIHGGPESQYRPYFSSRYQMWLAKLGVAVVAPNVRGSAGYGKTYVALDNGFDREMSVKDIGALLDWIETQPDLDADRVAVFGGSYGGYMVLASAVHYSDRLKAAVDIVGISNFVTFLENTEDYRRDLRRAEYGDERDPAMRAFLQRISPNNNVEQIDIPMFVAQGENDPRVPVTESEQIVAALREQDVPVWYMNALNEGHGFRKKPNRDLFSQITVLFLQQHLVEGDGSGTAPAGADATTGPAGP
jgi:dipeptidyl aminopeptidase/acylaminoacyl peptidase